MKQSLFRSLFLAAAFWMPVFAIQAQTPVVLELHGAFQCTSKEHYSIQVHPGSAMLVLPTGNGTGVVAFHPETEIPSRSGFIRDLSPMVVEPDNVVTRVADSLTGHVHVNRTVEYAGRSPTRFEANVDIFVQRNATTGRWVGTWTAASGQNGTVTGFDDLPVDGDPKTFVIHFSNTTPSTAPSVSNSGQVVVTFNGTSPSSVTVNGAAGRATSYGNNPPWPLPTASADGRLLKGLGIPEITDFDAEVTGFSGGFSGGNYTLTVNFNTYPIDQNFVRGTPTAHTVTLSWSVVGKQAWGDGTLDGGPIRVLGYQIDPSKPGMPGLVSLPALPPDTADAIEQRLPYAAAALADNPSNTRYTSPLYPTDLLQVGGGKKQYDHETMNGYGAVNSFLLAARYRGYTQDYSSAMRGGTWLATKRFLTGLASVYKTGFWWTGWQGHAFLDLYEETGHTVWLDLAKEYADVVRAKQRPEGTWTFVDPETGVVGTSFDRDTRENDFALLNNGEILWFLGRLRQLGVTSYTDVEEAAVAWHRQAVINGTFHWHSRRDGRSYEDAVATGDGTVETFPILTYLYYLLHYRTDVTPSEVNSLVSFVEQHGLVTTGAFAPSIIGYEPRHNPADTMVPATYTTAQMAVIDLLRSLKFGNQTVETRAHQMLREILEQQEPDTGLIDHIARNLSGYDLGDMSRMNEESHQYIVLRALTLKLLEEAKSLIEQLALPRPPVFSLEPADAIAINGESFALEAAAGGNPAPSFQWYKNGVPIPGANQATLSIPVVTPDVAGNYHVVVSNSQGNATSRTAVVQTVDPQAPIISTHPASVSAPEFTDVVLQVTASGVPAPSYQWFKTGSGALSDGGSISGSQTPTLSIAQVRPADAGNYYVVVSNSQGSATSLEATVSVTPAVAPQIVTHPVSVVADPGESATFTVTANGSTPLTYQWRRNGTNLTNSASYSGVDTPTLTVTTASATTAGNFSVVVTNLIGSATSNEASLILNQAPAVSVVRPLNGIGTVPNLSAWVEASATDDGHGGPITYQWSLVSGPGTVLFTSASAAATGVTFSTAGLYTLKITASDGSLSASEDVLIRAGGLPAGGAVESVVRYGTSSNMYRYDDVRPFITRSTGVDAGLGSGGNDTYTRLPMRSLTSPLANATGEDLPCRNFTYALEAYGMDTTTQPSTNNVRYAGPGPTFGTWYLSPVARASIFYSWDQGNFIISPAGETFSLNHPQAKLSVKIYRNTQGGRFRFAIRQNGQWYVSQASSNSTTQDTLFELIDSSSTLWAPFNPTALGTVHHSLWCEGLAYAPLVADNVDAVGFLVNSEKASNASHDLRFNDFEARLLLGSGSNVAPVVSPSVTGPVVAGTPHTLHAGISDDGNPIPPGAVTVQWSQLDGPGVATFDNSASENPQVTFPVEGTYVLRVIADDGAGSSYADVTVSVDPATGGQTYTNWINSYSATIPAHLRDPLDDFSGDGLPNLLKYAYGLDPTVINAEGRPEGGMVEVAGESYPTLWMRRRQGGGGDCATGYTVDGIIYLVETNSGLDSLGWVSGSAYCEEIGSPVDNGDGTETVTVRTRQPVSSTPRQFLRLRVTLLP